MNAIAIRSPFSPAILILLAALISIPILAVIKEAHTVDWPVAVNEANFPDPIWRDWVNTNAAGGDNELTQAEAEGVASISANGKGIVDLRSIEYFKSLKELCCSDSDLVAFDVSNNTALNTLWCYDNELLFIEGVPRLDICWMGQGLHGCPGSSHRAGDVHAYFG